ncbi:MAG TPA: GNAT family N-acetyltransferase [Dehalococcoidales bacterium]|jgi:ribosomal protein S18 acetylase RimI-like enzyme|nr:GNAT family N-acetyltransferase [Dehalococcoidales bacterium]
MLEIRRYQDADNPAVWELHHRALEATGAYFPGKWNDDIDDIQNHYLNNGGEFLVGILDGKIVCMGAFRRKSDTLAEIKRMRVLPEYQRRGLGQAILNQLEAKAILLGYRELCLDTTTLQIAAQKMYEKNGFTEVRRGLMPPFEVIYYHKSLNREKMK